MANIINKYDNYATIITSSNQEIIIDLEDVVLVEQYNWWIHNTNNLVTASVGGRYNAKKIFLHRLVMNVNDNKQVDHINHNRLDNRKSNLRICTLQENNFNKKPTKANLSGVTGVNFDKRRNKWRAYIVFNYKQISLGYFKDFDDAVNKRKDAEKQYFGEFAYNGGE